MRPRVEHLLLRSFSCRVKYDSTGSEVTGGEKHEVLNVAWEIRTSPVLSESSSEKDCFLRFRTWLELMQLRTNFERSCKPFKTEDIPYGMSFF
jgi:hypothetical protein